jgi:hypothetical protein
MQQSAGSSALHRHCAWLPLKVEHVHPGAISISPGHGRQQQWAARAERGAGGHGPPLPRAPGWSAPVARSHGDRLQERAREALAVAAIHVTDLHC